MFPYRCETFTTANVSVLNVFKTSVDTINASSITSDMTIGANLNGGSLTLGANNATVNVSGNTINIGAPSNIINVGAQVNRTGLISIGSNSASTTATGGLNLGSVSSGTGSVQLANGTSQTANIIIGNGNAVVTGSDKIIIGKSGKTVSISGATTLDNGTLNLSNATINVNSPLTVGYTSAPTTSQIGGISSVFNASGLPLTTSPFLTISMTTSGLPLGNYIGRVYIHINPSVATAKVAFATSGGSGVSIVGANDISYNASGTAADGFDNNLVFFFTVTNATTSSITYTMYSATANSTLTVCYLQAMRIG